MISAREALSFGLLLTLVAGGPVAAAESGAPPALHHHRHHRHPLHHAQVLPVSRDGGPPLASSAALVLDETNAAVLYQRNAESAMPIASITKLMTALVVTEAGQPLEEPVRIADEDGQLGTKGGFSRLRVGTELTRGDLIHLALMSSENRAAHALGRTFPGGLHACVEAMNAKARSLGMVSSHFTDPTGLSVDNVASPADLARLVLAAAQNPVIRDYSTDPSYTVRVGRHLVEFHNTDALVRNPDWNIEVQKTGYISEAGRCLVMKAVIRSREVVIVLLNSLGKNTRVADARRIRRWMETRLTEQT